MPEGLPEPSFNKGEKKEGDTMSQDDGGEWEGHMTYSSTPMPRKNPPRFCEEKLGDNSGHKREKSGGQWGGKH